MEEEPVAKEQPVMPWKRMMSVAFSLMAIGICLFLFLPSLLTGNPALEQGSGDGSDSGAGVVPKSDLHLEII